MTLAAVSKFWKLEATQKTRDVREGAVSRAVWNVSCEDTDCSSGCLSFRRNSREDFIASQTLPVISPAFVLRVSEDASKIIAFET